VACLLAPILLLAGCQEINAVGGADAAAQAVGTGDSVAAQVHADVDPVTSAAASMGPAARTAAGVAFASLEDRGDLVAYPAGRAVRRQGAYTWHRADVSEAHALAAIGGVLRITAPDGRALEYAYEHHVEHPSGDWTWVGRPRDGDPGQEAIITFGADAVFGALPVPGDNALRMTTRDGAGWLVETDGRLEAAAGAAAHATTGQDFLVPEPAAIRAETVSALPGDTPGTASAPAPAATTTVDVLVGYTGGFAAAQGSGSAALTRIHFLVDVGNQALANSAVSTRVRLVHAMQVNYTDGNANDVALEQMTGYDQDANRWVTPAPAFDALRAARETYGADLVSLVRDFRTPEHDGCGIAWLIGGGLSQITQGYADFGYSVVSDGIDADGGSNYFCRDETFIHELGHNMGSAHDVETAKGDDGVLENPDDYGRYTYSFGYRTTQSTGNFYTVMAYGESGQTAYRIFSNPDETGFCGGRACGTSNADNARSLRGTSSTIAQFRPTRVQTAPPPPEPAADRPAPGIARSDVNGDGNDDLLFRGGDQFVYWLMDGPNRVGWRAFGVQASTRMAGYGDLDGNGRADIVWIRPDRSVIIWLGNGSGFSWKLTHVHGPGWDVAAVSDMDGDGRDDLVWYSPTARQIVVWYMAGTTRRDYRVFNVPSGYVFAGSGHFDGDDRADLVWASSSRVVHVWFTRDGWFARREVRSYQPGWRIVATRDVHGDGISDLHWHNAGTGQFVVWRMDGASVADYDVYGVGEGVLPRGSGDFDGNGRGDMIWRNGSRDVYIWLRGTAYTSRFVARNGLGWDIYN
jgi:hypothetical protein